MKTITLAIVAAFAASGCMLAHVNAPGVSGSGLATAGQLRDFSADQNAARVQTLGIATGTPTATATEAQQMTSGDYAYGYPYGAVGMYGYGAGATIVSPSYYMSGVSIPPLPEGGLGGVGASPSTTIQPIIIPVPGSSGDAAMVRHLMNANGHAIQWGDTLNEIQKFQHALLLHQICILEKGMSQCPEPEAPEAIKEE